jgi:hypothetical protein
MPVIDVEFAEQVASNSSNVTVNQFQKYRAERSLILRPPFQRNLVWNDEQKSFLIDSVLRGLPVPEVYVQSKTSAEGDEEIVVVDGQQRISACLQFLSGDLRVVGKAEEYDARWWNRTFAELDPDLQKRFRSYELIVRKLPDLDEPTLREIFRRLNKTVEPLLPQELRHAAYTGPFVGFVETAAARPVLGEIGVFTARDYLRRRSDELIAEIAAACIAGAYPNKKEGLDELFLTYEKQGVPPGVLEKLGRQFGRVFDQLDLIGSALRRTRFRNKSDFYTLFVAMSKDAQRLPLDAAGSEALADGLRRFSDLVNDLKREEGEGRSTDDLVKEPVGAAALKYLRAVERAASDRLSRVRRDEALQVVLGPLLAVGGVKELTADDEEWLRAVESEEDEEDEAEEAAERAHLQEVLTSSE